MICDFLRSCYSTTARLRAGSDVESPIIWYWADPDAQLLPHGSSIRSLNWIPESDDEPGARGEIRGRPRPWRNGSMPDRPAGQDFHGQASWFNDGVPAGQQLDRSPSGIPFECLGEVVGLGGAELGGEAILDDTNPTGDGQPCPADPIGDTVQLQLINPTGIMQELPLMFHLTYQLIDEGWYWVATGVMGGFSLPQYAGYRWRALWRANWLPLEWSTLVQISFAAPTTPEGQWDGGGSGWPQEQLGRCIAREWNYQQIAVQDATEAVIGTASGIVSEVT